jgi:hypothetical protein
MTHDATVAHMTRLTAHCQLPTLWYGSPHDATLAHRTWHHAGGARGGATRNGAARRRALRRLRRAERGGARPTGPHPPPPLPWPTHSARTLHSTRSLFSPPRLTQCPHSPLASWPLLTGACAHCVVQVHATAPHLSTHLSSQLHATSAQLSTRVSDALGSITGGLWSPRAAASPPPPTDVTDARGAGLMDAFWTPRPAPPPPTDAGSAGSAAAESTQPVPVFSISDDDEEC